MPESLLTHEPAPRSGRGLDSRSPAWVRAAAAYPNLIYFNEVDEGNHFAAWQEPELFATEVRAAFRSVR
jgi:pimeloyl-ACP methyl ester carboxylesterase